MTISGPNVSAIKEALSQVPLHEPPLLIPLDGLVGFLPRLAPRYPSSHLLVDLRHGQSGPLFYLSLFHPH